MNNQSEDQVIKRVRGVLAGLREIGLGDHAGAQITRLGGLTNLVFRVETGGRDVCLRLAGAGTEDYIDRKVEAHNARAAAAAGVGPKVIHADAATGVMVTQFLSGCQTMTPALFASTPGAAARAGRALRRLHDSGQKFQHRFELFAMIDEYLALLEKKPVPFPKGYHQVLGQAEAMRAALAVHPGDLAPCHCDPLAENFLDDGTTMWIVDWEYSGRNDPLWDLGDLSVEGSFDAATEEELINAYFGGGASDAQFGRIVIYKAACDLLWTLWGLIQLANDNQAEDFAAYAQTRFSRCERLMSAPGFVEHLRAVEKD
ncbi:MAG: choline/ethanolamine kinase family protein [Alphaproteobacteria bacterium]